MLLWELAVPGIVTELFLSILLGILQKILTRIPAEIRLGIPSEINLRTLSRIPSEKILGILPGTSSVACLYQKTIQFHYHSNELAFHSVFDD